MHAVTNIHYVAATQAPDIVRFDHTKTVRALKGTEYSDRRDDQHRLLWDQEPARITFAETPTVEESALSDLLAYVRQSNLNPLVMPPPVSSAAQEIPLRDPYAPAEDETCMHISSYENLMRSTSYRLLQAHAGSFSEIPVSAARRIEVSLNQVVDSADCAAAGARSAALYLPTAGGEEYRPRRSRTNSSAGAAAFARARASENAEGGQLRNHFLHADVKQALLALWDKVVAKQNASLMLQLVRRKLKSRYRRGARPV